MNYLYQGVIFDSPPDGLPNGTTKCIAGKKRGVIFDPFFLFLLLNQ